MEVIGKALATIEEVGDDLKYGPHGGFTCIASTPSEDRDGDNLYQAEWKSLPEHVTVDLDHGMSVATTVGSGRPYFNSDGNVQTDVALSSIARAQEARTLINEGHIRTVSVAFMTDKTKKSGEPRRELLNLGIVAIPSNREAVILDSKALDARAEELAAEKAAESAESKSPEPYGDVRYADPEEGKYPIDTVAHIRAALAYIGMERNRAALGDHLAHVEAAIHAAAKAHGIDASDPHKSAEVEKPGVHLDIHARLDEASVKRVTEELKALGSVFAKAAGQTASGIGGDGALVQAIHDAASHLGAACPVIEVTDEDDGASSGANKSVDTNEARELQGIAPIAQDGPADKEAFEKALDQVLTPQEEPPAEAAAATDEVPAPADEAAGESDAVVRARAMQMSLALLTPNQYNVKE